MTVPAVAAVAGSPQATLADWRRMIADLSVRLGWSTVGSPAFSSLVSRDDRVLVKPNWVLHRNHGTGGFTPLVTHGSVVRAVTMQLLASAAARVTVGDAGSRKLISTLDGPALVLALHGDKNVVPPPTSRVEAGAEAVVYLWLRFAPQDNVPRKGKEER